MTDAVEDVVRVQKRQCIRVETNGARTTDLREDDAVELWVKFNKDFRPGAALFVDRTCRSVGGYTKEQCEALAAALPA